MRKLLLIFIVFQITIFQIRAQNPEGDKEQLKKINQELLADYKLGKFDESLILAQKAVDLSEKVYGKGNGENASAFRNLGLIYHAKKKYGEAAINLQKSVDLYNMFQQPNFKELAKTLDKLALALAFDGNSKESERVYTLALLNAEKAYGTESKELLPYLKSMAEVYILVKKYDEAQQIFIREYQTAQKYLPPKSGDLQEIGDSFYCFSVQYFSIEESVKRQKVFNEAVVDERNKPPAADAGKSINGGVINGKAKSLVKPAYPSSARQRYAQGTVPVRVLIDTEGNVVEARALCGDPDLRAASEDAARKSKFSPTILSGVPVKVSGIITYLFVP